MRFVAVESSQSRQDNVFSPTNSGYGVIKEGVLISVYPPDSPEHQFHQQSHSYFRQLVGDTTFACLAGQTVIRSNRYAFCAYHDMTNFTTAEGVCHDLTQYMNDFAVRSIPTDGMRFNSFIAAFQRPLIENQLAGSRYLYQLLLHMHHHDKAKGFAWNPSVSNDTESPSFGYSIAENTFYIPLLYSSSSSEARRSVYTFVVFNSHLLFEKLRANNAFIKLRDLIRARQSEVHPNLTDHGSGLEFIQYALVSPDPNTQDQERKIRKEVLGPCPFASQ